MIWITKLYIWIHLSGLNPDCQWTRGAWFNILHDRCRWKHRTACGVYPIRRDFHGGEKFSIFNFISL
jgi:hypothetical protein